MSLIVPIVGVLILGKSLFVVVSPGLMRRLFSGMVNKTLLGCAAVFRIVVGVLFLIVSGDTRFPVFIFVMGVLLIVAGASIPFTGMERIERIVRWWMGRSDGFLRSWALVAAFLGVALIRAGV